MKVPLGLEIRHALGDLSSIVPEETDGELVDLLAEIVEEGAEWGKLRDHHQRLTQNYSIKPGRTVKIQVLI